MAYISGRRRDRIVGGFTTTCGKVPITIEVVRWNPAHGELYSTFVPFLLAIVLSVLLQYTDSDCTFGILKLLLTNNKQVLPIFL
jgi:hypothetical protein